MKAKSVFGVLAAGMVFVVCLSGCSGSDADLTDEVKPYLEYLGGTSVEIDLPEDLYNDKDSVSFAGKEGSIEMGQSVGAHFLHLSYADELTWTSNDTVTHDEFEKYKKNIDKYYGFEAEEVKVSNRDCYRWEGDEVGCMVTASYSSGHAKVEFQIS